MSTSTYTLATPTGQIQKLSTSERFFTIDGLLKSHASEPEDPPLIGYPASGLTDFEEHTARHLDKFTDAAVARYIGLGLKPADSASEKAPVVAILAPSSLETVVTIFALNRLGWAALFLSTRLSAPAYVSLLSMADCNRLITTSTFAPTVKEIQKERECTSMPMLSREDYRNVDAPKFHRDYDPTKESRKIAWIIHSSGSTGFPKPIFLSNSACIANFKKNFSLRAFCTSPLFHSQGLMELFRAIYSRSPMYLGNYAYPVTRQNLVDAMRVAKPQLMCVVPYTLKLLAESDDGISELAKAKLVLFAGSSCPDDLGDLLVSRGVNVVANYGCTETGLIMTSFRPPGDSEWNYVRLLRPVADHVLMDEIAPGVFECVGLDGLPSKGPSNSSDPPNSFRTRDLFSRHPDPKKSNFWKYLSRLDDRITLVNGEKVLPIGIEGRIRQEELVREAAVFGVGKTMPGVMVFKSERATHLTDEEYVTAIWPAIESANASAETFSQIPKELIIIFSADTVYPKTDKGTFIRAQLYKMFADDIEAAYGRFEHGQVGTLQLDVPELEAFLLNKFKEELDVHLESVKSDIFAAGVDSLQTTRMWRLIKKELDLGGNHESLSQNIVFEKGNIRALAKYLFFLRTSHGDEEEDELELMKDMIEKYSNFDQHKVDDVLSTEKDVVLVTGTTGTLGTFLLAELVKRDHVSKVWALVRASDASAARSRVLESLSSRNLGLSEKEMSKIIALPGNFSDPNLGLSEADLQTLLTSLTHVIHSAWAVNFNLGVRSFESQHIRGVYNLLNICLRTRFSSPAKFFFCSSVSAAAGTPKPALVPEAMVEELNHAQKMGYGRSKLVSEHIVRNAMRSTGMYARVLRIGQVAGDGATGQWNDTEAVALMIRSAISVGALPALDDTPSWLPVDLCASVILGLTFLPEPSKDSSASGRAEDPNLVYHILNPRSFHWTSDLLPALRRTKLPTFDTVSPEEWLRRLKESNPDPVKNPSIKLVDFWDGKYGKAPVKQGDDQLSQGVTNTTKEESVIGAEEGEEKKAKGLVFETYQTIADCPLLGQAPDVVKEGYIDKYVDSWLKKWGV